MFPGKVIFGLVILLLVGQFQCVSGCTVNAFNAAPHQPPCHRQQNHSAPSGSPSNDCLTVAAPASVLFAAATLATPPVPAVLIHQPAAVDAFKLFTIVPPLYFVSVRPLVLRT